MTLIYIAHPIDKTNPAVRAKVSGALAALGGGRGHLEGNHLYIPSAAFKIGPGCTPDQTINKINDTALEQAGKVLALWPLDAKSWGVPIEVDWAIKSGKHVALVVEDDPTWAMQYGGLRLKMFKVDPREHNRFTMATLRAMDWLTGYQRDERKLTITPNPFLTPAQTAEAIAQAATFKAGVASAAAAAVATTGARIENTHVTHDRLPDIDISGIGRHPATVISGDVHLSGDIHLTEAQFLGNAVSEGATEGLTQTETDEEGQKSCEDKGDPTEPQEIGFRNLIHYGEDVDVKLPTRGYGSDAGLDIYVSEDTIVEPGTFADIRSHVAVNLPKDTWAYLVGRSSTLRKKGLLVNPGVIDNGYTGELYSAVWNMTSKPVKVHAGERIAQLILMPNITPAYQPVWTSEADTTERGAQGFGSSGV